MRRIGLGGFGSGVDLVYMSNVLACIPSDALDYPAICAEELLWPAPLSSQCGAGAARLAGRTLGGTRLSRPLPPAAARLSSDLPTDGGDPASLYMAWGARRHHATHCPLDRGAARAGRAHFAESAPAARPFFESPA